MTALLSLKNVCKQYHSGWRGRRVIPAVDGVTLEVRPSNTLGIVGESGSGKSTLCRLALGLIPPTSGRVLFEGKDIARLNGHMRPLRRQIQAVFQDADGALNPRLNVRELLLEPARIHHLATPDIEAYVGSLLDLVQLTPDLLCRGPHELSGGQRQRICLARAMSLAPRLVVTDEPIASLDPSAQAHLLSLLQTWQLERNLAYMYVSHDLKTVRYLAHEVAVMYLGVVVEQGPTEEVFDQPEHPYTRALLASAPGSEREPSPVFLESDPPNIWHLPAGCRFHPRCPEALPICSQHVPPSILVGPGHSAVCHLL